MSDIKSCDTTSTSSSITTTSGSTAAVLPLSREHVQEPWYTHLLEGRKTVEGRLNRGSFAQYAVGDRLHFFTDAELEKEFLCEIVRKTWYPSIADYLHTEGLEKTLPGISTISEGVEIYRRFYKETEEKEMGMLAIEIVLLSTE